MTDGSPKDRDDPPDDDFAEGLTEGGETKDGAPDVDEACDESVGDETLEEDAAGEDAAGEDDVVAADAEPGRAAPGLIVEPDGGVNSVVVQDAVPDTMFVFPLQKSVPFPSLMMPLLLDSSAARDVVAKAEANNGYLFLVLQKDPEQEDATSADELYEVGVITRIVKTLKLPDGSQSAMTQGVRRARRVKVVRERPHLFVRVQQLVEIPAQGERADSMFRLLQAQLQQLAQLQEQADSGFATALLNVEDPGQLSDFTAGVVRKVEDRQRLLEAADVAERLELALQFAMAENEVAALDQQIQDEIREKAEKAQKEYFLKEQLKIIRRELGEEQDPRMLELQRLEQAIEDAGMSDDARRRADEEMTRMKTTPVESGEYSVIRNYLDWLTSLPWSRSSADHSDLARAARVLHEDHYGLEEVKERILEFLAVRKLRPDNAGSILCFSGPPGVGKTSLGRSIARAMGREFFRFSLGGMRDEAEIKGHRRTYVGALPGRILQGLKSAGTNNPVILLDEIDKLGSDYRGDPSSALLEVLDPEQNHAFLDHYLDVPFDLSKVMFLATANVLSMIPEPLRDRMEILELPGYLLEEKVEIGRRHLLPKQLERHGLQPKHLSVTLPVWQRMVPNYTREAGVRGLDKVVRRLCRKVARLVASDERPPGRLSLAEMESLLGRARFRVEDRRKQPLPGVVQGLAWTPVGGDVLYVEAARSVGKGTLQLTGSLGDVMSESARLALSYLRSRADRFGLDVEGLDASNLHLHFPSGAIKKDGPSAGIAIACAFVSALTDRPAPVDVAMTGELTVVGEVLPIGGVREKVLAAKNFGIRRVILPKANEPEAKELKPELVRGIRFSFVERFDEVFAIVFGDVRAGARAATSAKKSAKRAAKKTAKKTAKKAAKKAGKKTAKKPAAAAKAGAKAVTRKRTTGRGAKKVAKTSASKRRRS